MLTQQQWGDLATYSRTKLLSLFDPAAIFAEKKDLRKDLTMPHKGLYIAVEGSGGESLGIEGFMQEKASNVLDGADTVIQNLFASFKEKNVVMSKVQSGSFKYTLISAVDYLSDPLQWNEESDDGVYFMWGQNYSSMFLPHEIQKMGLSKIGVLDRLCSLSGTVSSLWRYPCGLCFRLSCHCFSA